MKSRLFLLLAAFAGTLMVSAKDFKVTSPDGNIQMSVKVDGTVSYSVSLCGKTFIDDSKLSMTLQDGRVLGEKARLSSSKKVSADESFPAPMYRQATVRDCYNGLVLKFSGQWGLEFRAYDQGVAYRFVTNMGKNFNVVSELASFNFTQDFTAWIPYADDVQTAFERKYQIQPLSSFKEGFSITPLLVDLGNGYNAVITESDLEDFPGMFLEPGADGLQAKHAYIPEETYREKYRCQEMVRTYSDVLAECKGKRTFPWRIIAVGKDTDLPQNDLVYLLGSPSRIADTSWIRPGKVAWDWWNDWSLTGVDFIAGINNDTYKYYIDFASKNGIEYVVLDEGWSPSAGGDIMKTIPEIDLEDLVAYAAERNVKLILWAVAYTLDDKLEEACSTYSKMGIAGFKVDFINRDDQKAVNMLYRILDVSAKYNMVIDYHGMYKPTGLNRTYPNLLNYEGVYGLENMKWSTDDEVTYDVQIPYIRMMAGMLDYTPGAMHNESNLSQFVSSNSHPGSQGTRCHQVAMYVVYDSPLEMLCDNPSVYMKEQETVEYITAIPTVFDETRIIAGEKGKFIVTARRKGDVWYIGCLNGWEARDLDLDLSFIGEGTWTADSFTDGVNVAKSGNDYKHKVETLDTPTWKVSLASGGGAAMVLRKK